MHEWNTIPHLSDYEGDPEARPFTREEMQRFLDYADTQVDRAVRAKRKGELAAYRDATLLRCCMVGAFAARKKQNLMWWISVGILAAPEFGRYGMLNVRYGKAKRGQPTRRRNVAIGDGVGGGGRGRLCGERAGPVWVRRASGVVGDRARWPDQTGGPGSSPTGTPWGCPRLWFRIRCGIPTSRTSPRMVWTVGSSNARLATSSIVRLPCIRLSADYLNAALHRALTPVLGNGSVGEEGR